MGKLYNKEKLNTTKISRGGGGVYGSLPVIDATPSDTETPAFASVIQQIHFLKPTNSANMSLVLKHGECGYARLQSILIY